MNIRYINCGSYRIGLREDIKGLSTDSIISLVSERASANQQNLEGRAGIKFTELAGVGSVAVKHYMRGGVLGKFVSRHYLKWGPTRSELEFAFLEEVRKLGVNAPLPIAFVSKNRPFYKAWLITSVIADTISLAELSKTDLDRASRLLVELVRQISLLIRADIWHVDLHPGNVLVDSDDKLYLVDFDKAEKFSGTRYQLRDQYLFRWRRAVIKHQLSEVLSEIVCLGLRSYHEEQAQRLT